MATEQDLKKHFEAILGREIDAEFPGEVVLREYTALYSFEDSWRTSREIGTTGNSSKACGERSSLTIGGIAATKADGKVELLLSDFHCRVVTVDRPIICIATAQSRNPVFVTVRTTPISATDVKIEIFAWDANGAPRANTFVNWFCQIPVSSPID